MKMPSLPIAALKLLVLVTTMACQSQRPPLLSLEHPEKQATKSVSFGRATIRGSMPRTTIVNILQRRRARIAECLDLEGRSRFELTVRIVVAPTGVPTTLRVVEGELVNPAAQTCLFEDLRHLNFPGTCAGVTIIDQPIVFRGAP